jgi:TP901 family phage tail tape measure protein
VALDRVVKIILKADIFGLKSSMTAASASVNDFSKRLAAADKEGARLRQNFTAVGDSAGKLGLVAAAGVGIAIKKFADFDQAMSNVAATGEDARNSIDALRDAAVEAGSRTVFSASEAAGAIENLAKAGLSASDILNGGLDGALDLAAAGGLEVADAAQYAAIAMKQFGLEGSAIPHIADLLSAGAGKAVGDVSDLGAALGQSGLVAKQTGLSIEETTGALAAFAEAGLLGSDSGTSLKSMLQSLTPSSDAAAAAMEKYNLSAYDAQGNFIGLEAFAGKLKAGLSGLSEEQRNATMKTIFGSDAVRAASVLYSQGAEGIAQWTAAVDDQGYAAETAAVRLDNLKGDLEGLAGALDSAFIGTGEGTNAPLRELVQLLTGLVNVYNDIPGPMKTMILATGALTAGIGGTVFVASRAVDAYASTRDSLKGLGVAYEGASKKALLLRGGAAAAGVGLSYLAGPAGEANKELGLLTTAASGAALGFAVGGPWGAAIGGGAGLLGGLVSGSGDASAAMSDLTGTLDEQTGALTENSAKWATKQVQDSGYAGTLADMGISLQDATSAILGNAEALDKVNAAASGANFEQGRALASIIGLSGGVSEASDKYVASKDAADGAAAATGLFGDEAAGAREEVESLKDTLDGLLDPLLEQDQATVAWRRSIAGLTDELTKNGGGLDLSTKAGQDNRDAIRERVEALKASAQADFEATGNAEAFGQKLNRGAEGIVKAGKAAGMSDKEMRGYLKTLGLTPEMVSTLIAAEDKASPKIDTVKEKALALQRKYEVKIAADTAAALNALRGVTDYIAGMNGKTIKIAVERGTPGGITKNATGGAIAGPGTGTSDSIPAWLSNGEHVLTAAEVQKAGGQGAVYRMRQAIMSGAMPAFKSGGAVNKNSLEINRQLAEVRDIERSLDEKETVGKGKAKRKRLVLRGLDRKIAQQELYEAKRELADLKAGRVGEVFEARQKADEAAKDAADKAAEDRQRAAEEVESSLMSFKSDFGKNFSIGSLTSASAVDRHLSNLLADSLVFNGLLSDLKSKGASPWLLQELMNVGPTKGAIRLARQYATDSTALANINAKAAQIDSASNQYAGMVNSPRFMQPGAWNPGVSNSQTITIMATPDQNAWLGEVRRVVRFEVAAMASGGGA